MLPNKSIKEDRSDREIDYMLSEKESCKVFLKEYNKTQMFCDSINERKKNKNEKKYNRTGKLFLIVEEGIGLTDKEAVEYYINQGKKFTNNIFNEIWLMFQSAGHYKIYLLKKNNFFRVEPMIIGFFGKGRKSKSYSLVLSESQVITFNFLVFLRTIEEIRYHLHSRVSKQREIKK